MPPISSKINKSKVVGKYEEAIRCFEKALEIDPNDTNS
jgi:tetratricopeptide (TPR) repeat protein